MRKEFEEVTFSEMSEIIEKKKRVWVFFRLRKEFWRSHIFGDVRSYREREKNR